MQILCILLVALGAGTMLYSIVKYYHSLIELKKQTDSKSLFGEWIYAACFIMMLFFLAGYAVNIIIYSSRPVISTQDLLIAVIFFFGAVFVFAMVTMLRRMFTVIREKKLAEYESRQKTDFLSRMSHEIRTPMNAIIGMTNIGKTAQEKERKDYCLDKIESASTHLLGIINNVLDMSKIEANKLELSYTNFSIENMLERVSGIVSHKIEEKKQHFTLSVNGNVPGAIKSDEQRLCQVIINLLGNAVKFTPGGGEISLFVRNLEEKDEKGNKDSQCTLQFEIKDTGIGITEEQQQKLFKPFEQADGSISRKYGGTGLGLVISKQIIELMGGSIWIESKAGKGASFIFNIRAEISHPDRFHEVHILHEEDGDSISKLYDFRNKKILIAEDIDINREIIAALLEPTGIVIDFAEDGRRAYELFSANPAVYDVILMDLHMPEVDGYKATAMIRKLENPHAKTVPIIAMTADVFREDIEKCLEAGMNDHVGKPLDINEVKSKLVQYAHRRRPIHT
ncbi:MAG: response regulator [Treponema sp.]|jgi:signal transduction histidine kinase|nr:response regulator [Treponema sp.]